MVTEVTPDGKKVAPPTAEHPYYYFAQNGGFHSEGGSPADNKPIAVEQLEKQLQASLKTNGFLPSTADHPPTLLLVFFWGIHSRLDENVPDLGNRNLLARARLLGGEKFAKELQKALDDDFLSGSSSGSIASSMHRLYERDTLTRRLIEQSFTDVYYVVVSCYDGSAAAKGQRRLLWRTKMCSSTDGISMSETLPVLVAGAADYFGREMTNAAVVEEHINRVGKVEIGPAEVKEYLPTDSGGSGAK